MAPPAFGGFTRHELVWVCVCDFIRRILYCCCKYPIITSCCYYLYSRVIILYTLAVQRSLGGRDYCIYRAVLEVEGPPPGPLLSNLTPTISFIQFIHSFMHAFHGKNRKHKPFRLYLHALLPSTLCPNYFTTCVSSCLIPIHLYIYSLPYMLFAPHRRR